MQKRYFVTHNVTKEKTWECVECVNAIEASLFTSFSGEEYTVIITVSNYENGERVGEDILFAEGPLVKTPIAWGEKLDNEIWV